MAESDRTWLSSVLSANANLEFRADAFNVTNSFRAMDPNVSLTGTFFGQIRSAMDPRIMQFALKYVF